ncbi:MAG: 1-acyl-sn-glycerol-3-phosphate acyltransferase [Saprospiraceae bacterium]|nr:1-acyl-sn-glycerol-3-phosphate acyltransferase [Saprospiraceae bacterium]
MSLYRTIAGKVWAIYGLVVFFSLVMLFFPFYLIFLGMLPRRYARIVIWFNHHIYPYIFFPLVGIWIKVHGRELIQKNKAYILVSNHRTAIDFVANPVAFPGVYKFLAKKELTKIPLLGFLVKRLCVLVDRKNPSSAARSMEWLKSTFSEGYSVFIYPEGTRNRSSNPLGEFYSGAFRLAYDLQTPIAVMTLQNVHKRSATATSLDLWPGVLHIRWSAILEPSDFPNYQAMLAHTKTVLMADILTA